LALLPETEAQMTAALYHKSDKELIGPGIKKKKKKNMESTADDVTWCNSKSYSRHCILPEVNTFILLPHTPQSFKPANRRRKMG
jgi:hypothetical protein